MVHTTSYNLLVTNYQKSVLNNIFSEVAMSKTCSRGSQNCTYAHSLKELKKTRYNSQENYLFNHNYETQLNNSQPINIARQPPALIQTTNPPLINLISIQPKEQIKPCRI